MKRPQIALTLPGCLTNIGVVAGFADVVNGHGSEEPVADVVAVAGSSGGAAKAAHIAFALRSADFDAVVADALADNRLLDPSLDMGDAGIFGGRVLADLLRRVFGERTMAQAFIPLSIAVTRVGGDVVYVTNTSHPHALVWRVLLRSMSAPPFFPVDEEPAIGSGLWSDGGIVDNTSDAALDHLDVPRLALRLHTPRSVPRKGDGMSVAVGLLESALLASSRIKSRRPDGVVVDCYAQGSGFDFSLPPGEYLRRWNEGASAAKAAAHRIRAMWRSP